MTEEEKMEMDRRRTVTLSTEQMDALAEKAAEEALKKVYLEVGRNIVTRILWWAGAVALAFYAGKTGVKFPPLP